MLGSVSWFGGDEAQPDASDLKETVSQEGELRGRLYRADGRRVERPLSLIAASRNWVRALDVRGRCDERGEFALPIVDRKAVYRSELQLTVEGIPVPPQRISQAQDGALVIILPRELGRGNDAACGGIVTGVVLDPNGAPLEGRDVSGEVRREGLLAVFGSSEALPAKTMLGGRFALEFTGGLALKRIYVDGAEPDEAYLERHGERVELKGSIRAGTFGLRLVRGRRLFGLL